MKVIGLTGGIASGKSTVSRVLEKQGAKIIDADIIARDIVQPGCPALAEIVKVFGKETLLPDGRLDRVYLGQKVFQNQSLRKVLNSITHPKIREQIIEELRKIERESPEAIAVVDAPLLIEAGLVVMVDEVWLVALPEEVQVNRLMNRDGLSQEEAKRRIGSQLPLAEKQKYAKHIIDTSGSINDTVNKVVKLWQEVCLV
ncbi:MAG: dephospho-CoA kinase [Clostridia bacterium]|nr:dephospho-CoA kinase [Clostridia bacterium]